MYHENIFKYASFDIAAVCKLASEFRPGFHCYCDLSQTPAAGSFNWTILITFQDGTEWILRSPRGDSEIKCNESNALLLASEAATLTYIKARSSVPVPHLYSFSCTSENTVGIPYVLMSKASGSPLSLYWNPSCRREISRADQEYLVFQLGTIAKELSRLSFDRAGSLFEEGTIISIKTCLSRGLLLNSRCHIENLPRGPFTSEWDYHAAHLQAYKEHAKYLQLGQHCFFAPVPTRSDYSRDVDYAKASKTWSDFVTTHSKIDSSENRIDYILAGEMLGESMVELSNSYPGNSSQRSKPRFALQHPDLNVDNIFVDKDMHITCIIDWQFCTTVPLSVLSVAPNLPQPRRELDPSLTPLFQRGLGISAANSEDQGYEAFRGRLMSLFSQILSFESTADFHLFEIIWGLLGNPVTCIPALFDSDQMKEHYRSLYYELKEEDQNETDIAIKEAQYFGRDVEGLAIARKLTLVSEWSSRYHEPRFRKYCSPFIADKRLWNWVRDSLEI